MTSNPNPGSFAPIPPPGLPPNYAPSGPSAYGGPPPDQDGKNMGMLVHLLGIFGGFLGTLIIWVVKKDTSPFIDDQGKEALNWQITVMVIMAPLFIIDLFAIFAFQTFAVVCFFMLLMLVVWVCSLVFGIMGAVAANHGNAFRYPFHLRLLK